MRPGTVCHSVAEPGCDADPSRRAGAPIPETVDGKSMIPNPDGTLPVIRQWLHGEHEAESTPIISLSRNTINTCGTHRPAGSSIFNLDEDRRELHNGIADTQYQERIGLLRGIADRGAEGAGGRLFRWSETDHRKGDHGTASVRVWNHLTRRRSRFKVSSQPAPVRRSAQSPVRPTARFPRVFLLHSASAGRQKELCPDRRR